MQSIYNHFKMKKITLVLLAFVSLFSFATNATEIPCALKFYPQANENAQVVVGNARFTVLTSRLIRMEWAEDGKFEDRATLGITTRNLPTPEFKVRQSKSRVIITTSDLTLTYYNTGKFTKDNLSVVFQMVDLKSKKGIKKVVWKPGMDPSGNLLGTTRTLDKYAGDDPIEPYDLGVISRDGWAVIDESERHVFVEVDSDWKYWVENRTDVDRQDWYMFAYGHEYKDAITDFTKIAGKVPLPPKYTFGYWWCRYWQYSDFEFIDLAQHFKDFNIPIDVMIIDMDWHETWAELKANTPPREPGGRPGRDEFGQGIGWTGYTWKKELFPNPDNFLEQLHRMQLKTSLNLHFNNGIQPYEEPYDRFVKDYLSRTSDYDGPKGYVKEDGSKAAVPFRIDQQEWSDAYFNSIIHPFEKQGVDFWWLDWQQWRNSHYTKDLNNTFWLNYTFFNDKVRQTEYLGKEAPRPMIYHRWGGIGSHRYQVGFSGDTYATWKVLSGLPYFTATASNVGYGYWGHDIGGHMQPKGVKHTDPELYTRWIQSGVFTPIFKTHSTKNSTMEKRFWVFPDHFDPMREAVRLRYDLAPYIYTAARQTYDTGISMCRPLYYYYPEKDEAYDWKEEFMFGDDILATVVCQPVDEVTGLAERAMWFPEGNDWYDVSTGTTYKGGTTETLLYTINENPYFVKAGAIIPMAGPEITSLQYQSPELRFFVAPGDGESSTILYEDDGESQSYAEQYATTKVTKKSNASYLVLKVDPRQGSFKGMLSERNVSVVLEGVFAPKSVKINGVEVPYSRFASFDAKEGKTVWGYKGDDLAVIIYVGHKPADVALEISCEFGKDMEKRGILNGKKGLIKRMMDFTPETKLTFEHYTVPGMQLPSTFMTLSQCGSYITEGPINALKYLEAIDGEAMMKDYEKWERLPVEFKKKTKAQLNFKK